jgi:ATP-binding cassette subfamily F protein uup
MLDEPTNDLDLGTLRLLEEALVAFGGSVIVVSHDRYFLNRVCTSILAFEENGTVQYHVGNYDRYLEMRGREIVATTEPTRDGLATATPARPRKLKYKEARELETIEAVILAAEDEVARLEAVFAAPDFYLQPKEQWSALESQLAAARTNVATLYARWAELERLEALSATA